MLYGLATREWTCEGTFPVSVASHFSFAAVGLIALAMSCNTKTETLDVCSVQPKTWQPADFEGTLLRCEVVPELCGLHVDSIIRESNLDVAIDVVFVGDGYTEASFGSYRDRVREWIDEVSADKESIVGRDPTLFNFHRVDVIGSPPQPRPLGTCRIVDPDDGSFFIGDDDARANRAAANAPKADVVVVVAAGSSNARANAELFGTRPIRMMHDDTHRVLTHEMGHALVGLGDEYVDIQRRHDFLDRYARWTGNPLPPNLSFSPGGDWDGLVNGAIEGGGRYAHGVYHPTNRCRMLNTNEIAFCPVCSAAVDSVLSGRRGLQEGRPRCGIAAGPEMVDALKLPMRRLLFFGRDGNRIRSFQTYLQGQGIPADHPGFPGDVASHMPAGFAYPLDDSTGATEVRVSCTDALGETNEASLDLHP